MADFYGTTAGADAYHTAHGNAGWTGDDATKEAALLIASEWLDGRYGDQFPGYRTGKASQVREWPRETAYDIYRDYIRPDVIPAQVERATYEIALREIRSPGSLYKDWVAGEARTSVSVAGAVSVTYAGAYSYSDAQVQIGGIAAILKPILSETAGASIYSGRTSRA